MQFIYAKEACKPRLILSVKEYAHVFKVRRVRQQTLLNFRNFIDNNIYTYSISEINKKEAILELEQTKELIIKPKKFLHIGWCIIDSKTVEKSIAMLNEMGVSKISFLYADYSQKQFKIDTKRLERILINSCEQCGRSTLMELEFLKDIDDFLAHYPNSAIVDFSQNYLTHECENESYLIGPEGGFSQRERKLFEKFDVYGLQSSMILRSESAVVGVCAKLLL